MSSRRKRLTDLFVRGVEVPMPDGSYLWAQAMNTFERDEAVSAAQIARSRLTLALKTAGDERTKISALFARQGRDVFIDDLADVLADDKRSDLANEIDDDEEWAERMRILHGTDFDDAAKPPDPAELSLLQQITQDWLEELQKRLKDEKDYQVRTLTQCSDDELIDEYLDRWLDRKASDVAQAEYAAVELVKGIRMCNAPSPKDRDFDHSLCDHTQRFFEGVVDVREAPDELADLLRTAYAQLNMSVRDPKGSGSPSSSSVSSPAPNEAAESTESTSPVDPTNPPGISRPPSTTP